MIQFVQDYGLWIALAGVFVAMHWFGMGCCGGRNRQGPAPRDGEKLAGNSPESGKPSEAAPKPNRGCH